MASAPTTRHGFAHKPALDGLRAIAVAVVVLYHLGYEPFQGGYLGVDTFFVLSGYLITSLLIHEQERNGQIAVGKFWTRRFKRLLPAVILLILGVAAYAELAADSSRLATVRGDSLATLGYVANWRMILAEASYFDLWSEASPLRHMWSLAIEEQFYVLWPLVVWALVGRRQGRLGWFLGVCLAGSVASVAAMAYLAEHSDRSRAYYGTDTRVHTLLIGAALAVILHRRPPATAGARRIIHLLGLVGAAGMVVAFARLGDDESAFYYGLSPLFAGAVALVIASGVSGPESPILRLLHHRPLRWLGDISYGVYLWHWPMIVWLTPSRVGLDGYTLDALRVTASLVLASLSYSLIEQPIRHGTLSVRRTAMTAGVTVLLTATVVMITTRGATSSTMEPTTDGAITVFTPVENAPPPLDNPGINDSPGDNAARPRTVALIGDSVADTLAGAFGDAYSQRGVTFASAATPGCGVASGLVTDANHELIPWAEVCVEAAPDMQARLPDEIDPDLVLWHSTWEAANRMEDGVSLTFGTAEHDQALLADISRVLGRLTRKGSIVVMLIPPPRAISDFDSQPSGTEMAHLGRILRQAANGRDDVQIIDLNPIVCPDGPPCAREVSGRVLRPDGAHYSEESAQWTVEQLLPQITELRWPDEVLTRR